MPSNYTTEQDDRSLQPLLSIMERKKRKEFLYCMSFQKKAFSLVNIRLKDIALQD